MKRSTRLTTCLFGCATLAGLLAFPAGVDAAILSGEPQESPAKPAKKAKRVWTEEDFPPARAAAPDKKEENEKETAKQGEQGAAEKEATASEAESDVPKVKTVADWEEEVAVAQGEVAALVESLEAQRALLKEATDQEYWQARRNDIEITEGLLAEARSALEKARESLAKAKKEGGPSEAAGKPGQPTPPTPPATQTPPPVPPPSL